jgi:hypothetical protein
MMSELLWAELYCSVNGGAWEFYWLVNCYGGICTGDRMVVGGICTGE